MSFRCRVCNRVQIPLWFQTETVCDSCKALEKARQERLSSYCTNELFGLLESKQFTQQRADDVLNRFRNDGLKDTLPARRSLYNKVYTYFAQDERITERETRTLGELRVILHLQDHDVAEIDRTFSQLQAVWKLRSGELPTTFVSIPLKRGETGIIEEEDVQFMQERVVNRRYEGGSQGVSFRICKGVSYRVGAHKGQLVVDRAIVPLAQGRMVITNKRLVFSSSQKAFSIGLDKILHIEPFTDGLAVTRDSSAQNNQPYYFQTQRADILLLALSVAMNTS